MRLKRRRLRLAIAYVVAVLLLLWSGLTGVERYYDALLKRQLATYAQEQQARLQWMLQAQLKNLQDELLLTALVFSQLPDVRAILKGEKGDSSVISNILSSWTTRSDYATIWVQAVSKDGISCYRSWTNRWGDNLLGVRPDLRKVLENPAPTTTLSLGRYALTAKAIVPVYEGKRFLGVLEVISDMRPIIRALKREHFLAALLVESRFGSQLDSAGELTRIGNWILLQSVDDPVLFGYLRQVDLDRLAQQRVLVDFSHNLAWWWIPIQTTAQGEVGAFVTTQLLTQHKQELVALFEREKAIWRWVVGLMAVVLPLLGVLAVVLNVEHRQLSQVFNAGVEWRLVLHQDKAVRLNRHLREALERAEVDVDAFMSNPLSYLMLVPAEMDSETWEDGVAYLKRYPDELKWADVYLGQQPHRMGVMMTPLSRKAWLLTLLDVEALCDQNKNSEIDI